jgi:quercetin dioxygenase-like cupin family protein
MTQAQTAASQGYVLGAAEGEHLALGTQQVPVGAGIPIHRHFRMDEAFYVLEGSGIFTLNDSQHPFWKGGTIFIPKNAWHGFVNPEHELLLLWIMAPAGLDGFFRDTCRPPGVPPKQLTREQVNEIARKYATEYR